MNIDRPIRLAPISREMVLNFISTSVPGLQVAIVAGGARGTGLAIAEAVAPLTAEGADIAAVSCDVTSERDLARVVRECLDRFGRVDVLVNNAGVTRDGYIGKLSEADFDLVLGVSLMGARLGTR